LLAGAQAGLLPAQVQYRTVKSQKWCKFT